MNRGRQLHLQGAGCPTVRRVPQASVLNLSLANALIASSNSPMNRDRQLHPQGCPTVRGPDPETSGFGIEPWVFRPLGIGPDSDAAGGRPFAPGLKLYLSLVEAVEVRGAALFAVCAKGASLAGGRPFAPALNSQFDFGLCS
jgi:hypothetical protein